MNDLTDAVLAFGRSRLAIEILADHHVGCQGAPGDGDFAVLLLEKDFAVLVLNLGRTLVPRDGVEWLDSLGAKISGYFHGGGGPGFLNAPACGRKGGSGRKKGGGRKKAGRFFVLCSAHAFLTKKTTELMT